jgi:hypothetical protein
VIERGVERRALRPELDVELLLDLLLGAVYYRLLLSSQRLEIGFAEQVVDAVLPAFAALTTYAALRTEAPPLPWQSVA